MRCIPDEKDETVFRQVVEFLKKREALAGIDPNPRHIGELELVAFRIEQIFTDAAKASTGLHVVASRLPGDDGRAVVKWQIADRAFEGLGSILPWAQIHVAASAINDSEIASLVV